MRKIIISSFLVLSFLYSSANAGIITVTHAVKQTFGGSQSPDDARISAIAKAKREALEKAGTYIESLTVVKNSQVDKDEILALAAGVLKAEVVSQKNYASDDAFGIEIIVNVVVDTSVLEERVKKHLQDKTHLKELKETQKREKELLQKVAELQEKNRKLSANKQSSEKLKEQFQQVSRGLTAVDWFYKAFALRDGVKSTDPKKSIEYLNNAIRLNPDYYMAYIVRGAVYADLGQYQRAIEDYNEAIRLKPDSAEDSYLFRGNIYLALGQRQRAIEDYNEAIRLKPDFAGAYIVRGAVYAGLGQYQRAIEDYNEAIRLKPDFALSNIAYSERGVVYIILGEYQRAIEDCNEVIRLKPDDSKAYYNRGNAYVKLGQYQRAIKDYNNAIRLKQDYAVAYSNRGITHLTQGNKHLGCRDVQKACELGHCNGYEWSNGKGYCR